MQVIPDKYVASNLAIRLLQAFLSKAEIDSFSKFLTRCFHREQAYEQGLSNYLECSDPIVGGCV